MAQDLRKLFNQERAKQYPMKEGHEDRFANRLDKALPQAKQTGFFFLRIAASVLILVSAGFFAYRQFHQEEIPATTIVNSESPGQEQEGISLGDLSPDLKKVEDYYVVNINLALADLDISSENKSLVDEYMKRLGELNLEYSKLNNELNQIGPNDQTITALIKNLQLRLQLLQKLKNKINEFKSVENEQVKANIV